MFKKSQNLSVHVKSLSLNICLMFSKPYQAQQNPTAGQIWPSGCQLASSKSRRAVCLQSFCPSVHFELREWGLWPGCLPLCCPHLGRSAWMGKMGHQREDLASCSHSLPPAEILLYCPTAPKALILSLKGHQRPPVASSSQPPAPDHWLWRSLWAPGLPCLNRTHSNPSSSFPSHAVRRHCKGASWESLLTSDRLRSSLFPHSVTLRLSASS